LLLRRAVALGAAAAAAREVHEPLRFALAVRAVPDRQVIGRKGACEVVKGLLEGPFDAFEQTHVTVGKRGRKRSLFALLRDLSETLVRHAAML
jgi:hypothetical protein